MTRAEAARTFDHEHRLLSHAAAPAWNPEERIRATEARLRAGKDLPGATVEQQIDMLYALTRFPLGRFLLENQGLNAYWTHELVTYRPGTFAEHQAGGLEYQIFEKMPAVLATRERFHVFRRQLQERLRPGITIASVPCGLMGDLLSLDFGAAPDVSLIGIDLDQQALDGARALALERGMSSQVTLRREDAWAGSLSGEADILTSNGLNIYEPNDERVIALYRAFFVALKPGGTLITSFLTPPPTVGAESSWDLSQIDQSSLALQYVLFAHILEVKWSAFRTQAQTRAQLERAGFTDIRFVDDRARMFPTVIAHKPE